ncbi:MAG: hypothetical protein HOP10_05365 [Chitinophagaceae bacterium]|nr:hypothetical protein [Chitinophagaceae bacterium]
MKRLLIIACLFVVAVTSNAQQLSQVTFNNGAALSYFSLLTDQGVYIRISETGKALEWGTELMSNRGNIYAPRLQPFMGRVEYYGAEADSAVKGKVKSIGTTSLTYYGASETESKAGKLKTVGTLIIDYYSTYDNAILKGKIRSIGNYNIDYYSSFDEESLRGKLKTVNNTPVTYYSSFDDKLIRGQIKSIGSYTYTWYTSLDLNAAKGALKTGQYRQQIGSITYILREGV